MTSNKVICGSILAPRCAIENKKLPQKQPRVAIVFYGLSRSLASTLSSIEKHVFKVLDKNNIIYDVFWSTLNASEITNERSHENHLPLNASDYLLMRPCVFKETLQSDIAAHELMKYHHARISIPFNQTDMYRDNFTSVQNMLCAFHSLGQANNMIQKFMHAKTVLFDAIIVLRPDTAVVTDIDIPKYIHEIINETKTNKSSIWIPDFSNWGGYNDRAAYGSVSVMTKYLMRGEMFRDYIGPGRIRANTEQFLKAYIALYNITYRASSMRVIRIRADHSVSYTDTTQTLLNMTTMEYQRFVKHCLIKLPTKYLINSSNC